MGARAAALILLPLAATVAACGGDPVLVLGDLPAVMRLIAGVPDSPGTRVEEEATASQLHRPSGLAVDDAGLLYVADFASRRVVAVGSTGRLHVVSDGDACGAGACPRRPFHLALGADGDLIVSDQDRNQIWSLDPETGTATPIAGTGTFGTAPDGQPAIATPLGAPVGVATLPDGTVVFSERAAHRVRVIDPDGRLRTLAGTGSPGFGGDGGPGTAAQLSGPTGLAVSGGLLFIADADNNRVRALDLSTGEIGTVAGSGVRAFGGDGGPAVDARLQRPAALAVSEDGRALFIADAGNHRIRRVDLLTGTISTFAGTGETEFNGAGEAAGETALHEPRGVATSLFGILFIADTEHHVIWRTTIERR